MKESKIMDAVGNIDDKYLDEALNYKAKRVINFKKWRTIGILAACLCMFFGIGMYQYNYNYKVDSVVEIDVNPSIEIKLSKSENVLSVVALNDDAKALLANLNFDNMDLDAVIETIMNAMVENGYLTDIGYSVNVSVENDDEKQGNHISDKLKESIKNVLDKKDMIGNVNSQTWENDSEIKELAKSYGVSVGKYMLAINVAESTGMTIEEAVLLSIEELWDLLDTEEVELISKDEALNIAYEHAGVVAESVVVLRNRIRQHEGVYTYHIEFVSGETELYIYKINAVDGSILEYEHAVIDNEDKDDEVEKPVLLSKKEVLEIICVDAGVLKYNIRLEEFRLNEEDGAKYYVEFFIGKTEYQYTVDALNGTILDKIVIEPEELPEDMEPVELISEEEALNIALEDAGVSAEEASKVKVCFGHRRVEAKYIISFIANEIRYEYCIDAVSGEIIHKRDNSVPVERPDEGMNPEEKPENEMNPEGRPEEEMNPEGRPENEMNPEGNSENGLNRGERNNH